MRFTLPCETYVRLTNALNMQKDETRPINCIRLDYVAGDYYAVATNAIIIAVQYLGKTDEQDGGICLINDQLLKAQCQQEIPFDGEISVDVIDNEMIQFAAIKTSFGYNHPGNGAIFPPSEGWGEPWHANGWKKIFPDDVATKSKGFIFMDTEHVANLGRCAPSGRIVFPEKIDSSKPVVVRDAVDPDWLGAFLPREANKISSLVAATLPDWL